MIRIGLVAVLGVAIALGGIAPSFGQESASGLDRHAPPSRSSFDGLNRLLASRRSAIPPWLKRAQPIPEKAPKPPEPEAKKPARLARFLDPVNPAQLQRRLDEAFGFDTADESDKPEAPELAEPVFVEFTRPLGALKYESELNYLVVAPTGRTPMSQFLEYEYVFADWKAVKLELEFSQGVLETIEPGYQRTLGVGRRGNWVHAVQINPEVFVRTGFIGGTDLYVLGWKPEKESPWNVTGWIGANRTQFDAAARNTPGGVGLGSLALVPGGATGRGISQGPGAVRTMANLDFGYKLSDHWTVGIENDAFINARYGEYLVLPHVNWQPSDYFLLQLGAGYYQVGHDGNAVVMMHANLIQPTKRKSKRLERDER